MQVPDKILKILVIPHFALLSFIFGMMLLAFPFGVYVVFHTDIGTDINFQYPLNDLDIFKKTNFQIPFDLVLGDAFIVLWCIYVILFSIAMIGPDKDFFKIITSNFNHEKLDSKLDSKLNYMIIITKWFSILIFISIMIDFIQQQFGIITIAPKSENNLIQFLYVSISPLVEEFGFRIILIGLPLFAFYSHKLSVKHFFNSLWNPNCNLVIYDLRKTMVLIILVGIFFGLAHIMSSESWSGGKFAQATASGIILGWLYVRFGIIVSILVHWGTNYFIFSYANFISQINGITIENVFSNSFMNSIEILFLVSGVFSVILLLITYFNSKNNSKLAIQ